MAIISSCQALDAVQSLLVEIKTNNLKKIKSVTDTN